MTSFVFNCNEIVYELLRCENSKKKLTFNNHFIIDENKNKRLKWKNLMSDNFKLILN